MPLPAPLPLPAVQPRPHNRRMYETLNPDRIVETIARLAERIGTQFPDSGLGRVGNELLSAAHAAQARATTLAKPNWPLRVGICVLVAAGIVAQVAALKALHLERIEADIGFIQTLEAGTNLLLLSGGAVWFLLSLEERFKRRRALDALHRLRSLAHIIDMHQLTKDPTVMMRPDAPRPMSREQLIGYLDCCADLLAMIGKLAALHAERMRDAVVMGTVTEIESLTSDLARKIWHKIVMVAESETPGHALR